MGLLVEGRWVDRWYDTSKSGGRFERKPRTFRDTISGEGPFTPEAGRYHLYVSYACPWAHRTLIMRALAGLEGLISVSVVDPRMGEQGWAFARPNSTEQREGAPAEAEGRSAAEDSRVWRRRPPRVRVPGEESGAGVDPLYGAEHLHQLYTRAEEGHTGRVTVPVLWDKERETIVNNESSEIIRIFDTAFGDLAAPRAADLPACFYPPALREEIDAINEEVYANVNNGVYRAGFATTQEAYDEAVGALFETLDALEERLGEQRYLVGETLTEADLRLFTTLVRFDAVYHGHFKCNRQRLVDYPNLWGHTREIYQLPGVAETVVMEHITQHYYWSHTTINPTRVVPVGPDLDFRAPHGRT